MWGFGDLFFSAICLVNLGILSLWYRDLFGDLGVWDLFFRDLFCDLGICCFFFFEICLGSLGIFVIWGSVFLAMCVGIWGFVS